MLHCYPHTSWGLWLASLLTSQTFLTRKEFQVLDLHPSKHLKQERRTPLPGRLQWTIQAAIWQQVSSLSSFGAFAWRTAAASSRHITLARVSGQPQEQPCCQRGTTQVLALPHTPATTPLTRLQTTSCSSPLPAQRSSTCQRPFQVTLLTLYQRFTLGIFCLFLEFSSLYYPKTQKPWRKPHSLWLSNTSTRASGKTETWTLMYQDR